MIRAINNKISPSNAPKVKLGFSLTTMLENVK